MRVEWKTETSVVSIVQNTDYRVESRGYTRLIPSKT